MNRKTLFIIGGAVVVVCCLCAVLVAIIAATGGIAAFGLTQPAVKTADNFMSALMDGDYDRAYGLCTNSLQEELGSAQDLEEMIESNGLRPAKWNFTSREVNNDRAQLEGDVTYGDDSEGQVSMALLKERGDWKVAGFRFQ